MQNQNRHHREEDRGVIYRMNKAGKPQSEIAQAIGFGQSAVNKELKRNKGKKGYRPKQAHEKSAKRKKGKNSRERVIQGEIKEVVEKRLKRKHSPEQISGRLKIHGIQVRQSTSISSRIRPAEGPFTRRLELMGKGVIDAVPTQDE